jgi:mannose-6-phosphate isomerase-like protein (cupin superfamily)/CDGSH-type Zn-finger protein
MMTSTAMVARPCPYSAALKAGRTYVWCRCGRSARQPYCDGSHQGTGIEPLRYTASGETEVLFCGCKQTQTPPFCDGAHTNLPGGSPVDDPDSPANQTIMTAEEGADARVGLDEGCYVVHSTGTLKHSREGIAYGYLLSPRYGCTGYTQLFLRVEPGATSPPMSFPDKSEVVIFLSKGGGEVVIGDRHFSVAPTDGIYVRPDETFYFKGSATTAAALEAFVLASPATEPIWPNRASEAFDAGYPERIARWETSQSRETGPRHYEFLVDKRFGSTVLTQFIGHIPPSKSARHRHLYEESLIIRSGKGMMWTDTLKCPVGAGDVIYLPRKVRHSLQAFSPEGLEVVGVITPFDNPSVNYFD